MSGVVNYDRQQLMSLLKEARDKTPEELEELSQTDLKTLRAILEVFQAAPNTKSISLEERKFKSLEARLKGEPSPLPKEGWITHVFQRIIGRYIDTETIRQELQETIDHLYQSKETGLKGMPLDQALQNAADNYREVVLQKLKDNLNNFSNTERLNRAKATLKGEILPKLNGNLSYTVREKLEWAKNEFEKFIKELESKEPQAPTVSLGERKISLQPAGKKVKFAENVTVFTYPKGEPITKPLAGRVKEEDPAEAKFKSYLGKIVQQLSQGNIFAALAGMEILRSNSSQRLPGYSQSIAVREDKLLDLLNRMIDNLLTTKQITPETADLLSKTILLLADSNVPVQQRSKIMRQLEQLPEGQLLQQKVAEGLSLKLKKDQIEDVSPPPTSPEQRIAKEHGIIPGPPQPEEKDLEGDQTTIIEPIESGNREEPIATKPMGEIVSEIDVPQENRLEELKEALSGLNEKKRLVLNEEGKLSVINKGFFTFQSRIARSKRSEAAAQRVIEILTEANSRGKPSKTLMIKLAQNKDFEEILKQHPKLNYEFNRLFSATYMSILRSDIQTTKELLQKQKAELFDLNEAEQASQQAQINTLEAKLNDLQGFNSFIKYRGVEYFVDVIRQDPDVEVDVGKFEPLSTQLGPVDDVVEQNVMQAGKLIDNFETAAKKLIKELETDQEQEYLKKIQDIRKKSESAIQEYLPRKDIALEAGLYKQHQIEMTFPQNKGKNPAEVDIIAFPTAMNMSGAIGGSPRKLSDLYFSDFVEDIHKNVFLKAQFAKTLPHRNTQPGGEQLQPDEVKANIAAFKTMLQTKGFSEQEADQKAKMLGDKFATLVDQYKHRGTQAFQWMNTASEFNTMLRNSKLI